MAITTRNTKGAPLTHAEMDANFTELDTRVDSVETNTTNVDNTSDADKIVSGPQQTALNLKVDDTQIGDTVPSQSSATGATQISTGTDAQRTAGTEGELRRNSEQGIWEGYDGADWSELGGGGGVRDPATSVLHFNNLNAGPMSTTLEEIAYSPTQKCFVASQGNISSGFLYRSVDGITWTSHAATADDYYVFYVPTIDKFVAAGLNGNGRVATSTDGITWTVTNSALSGMVVMLFDAENDRYYFFDKLGDNEAIWTDDFITFNAFTTNIPTVAGNPNLGTFNHGSGQSPTIGNFIYTLSTDTLLTSTDFITWTATSTIIPNAADIRHLAENDTILIGGDGATNTNVLTSVDGITWTEVGKSFSNILYRLRWDENLQLFIATGYGYIETSPNGINWTNHILTTDTKQRWRGFAWSEEMLFGVGVGSQLTTQNAFTTKKPISTGEFQIHHEGVGSSDGGNLLGGLGTVRIFNVIDIDTIAGASIEQGVPATGGGTEITLPAGTYKATGNFAAYRVYGNYVDIWDQTLGAVLGYTTAAYAHGVNNQEINTSQAMLDIQFTIATETLIWVRHWAVVSNTNGDGQGKANGINSGSVGTKFSNLHFIKIG